jgi:serine/threonine protein kinase
MEAVSTTYGEPNCIKQVNHYVLLRAIGEGSFSRVFVARETATGQLFAVKRVHLKTLAKSSIGMTSITREIALMSRLSHPNIVTLHESIYVKETQVIYLVLDYAGCGNIAALIKRGHNFSHSSLRCIFRQIVDGVSYLHSVGIVHQDLKPENILLTADGVVLISDFGTGHSFHSHARGFGTPAYQAPELVCGAAGDDDLHAGKEDIWSLGVMLHTIVFGKCPFGGRDVFEVARAASCTALEQPKGADDELWDLIVHMLSPDPAHRFAIGDVVRHPWLRSAPRDLDCVPPVHPIVLLDDTLPVHVVQGKVLSSDGQFELPEMKGTSRFRHFNAPFPIDLKSGWGLC